MHRRLAALLAGAIVVAMTTQVDAETITVCADGCDYTSINAAIAAAADGDIIQLAAETYREGEEIDTLGKSISILGTTDAESEPTTVLDGQNAHRILTAVGGTTLVVQDVRFTNGNAGSGDGGGLFAESVTVDVVNCRFKECQGESGGGIHLRFADGSTIIFTTFETCVANSTSYAGGGGGTYLDGSADVTLEFVSFSDCSGSSGGGLFADSGSDGTVISAAEFESCQADYYGYGGGAYLYYVDNTAFEGTSFSNCSGLYGGGLFVGYSSDGTLVNGSRFEGNVAASLGGGIYHYGGSLAVSDTHFCGNDGGAIIGTRTENGGNCFATECVDSDGDGISDCVPWTDDDLSVPSEYATVEEAFAAALDGATIRISAGVHVVSSTLDTFGRSLTILGETDASGDPMTILDGQDATRILLCTGGTSSVVIRDMVFANGNAGDGSGGGLHANSVTLNVANCLFEACRGSYGGGAYLGYANGSVFTSATFTYCAANWSGGGAYLYDADNAVFDDTNFRNCSGSYGGGLYVGYSSDGTLVNASRFEGNVASNLGGGIYRYGGSLAVSDTCFCGNDVAAIFGTWTDNGGNCFATDCIDSDGDGISDCVPWTDDDLSVPSEYATVEEAFAAALDGATIRISAGVHAVSSTLDTLGRTLTILGETDDSGEPITVLDGQDVTRILLCAGGTSPVVIQNMVFANGNAGDGYGGGLYANSVTLDVANCVFEACRGSTGGGAYLRYSAGSVFTSTTFTDCVASSSGGGAYLRYSAGSVFASTTFTDCVASSSGGGAYLYYAGNTAFEGTSFSNCSGSSGGGACLYSSNGSVFTSTTFTECVASSSGGGAFLSSSNGSVFASTTFTDCVASSSGGGAYLSYADNSFFEDASFNNCSSSTGGGLYVGYSSDGTLVNASRFEGNVASNLGGGIYRYGGSLAVSDALFCGNDVGAIIGTWTDNGGNCFATECIDSDGDGITDCVPWTDDDLSVPSEYATVEEAFAAALDGATIRISAGVHVVSSTLDTFGRSLTILGETDASGEPMTVLDGQDATRILLCRGGISPVVIRDMVFANGNAGNGYGGGLHANSVTLDVANCLFEACRGWAGGGAYLEYSNGSVFASTTFTDCVASSSGGGLFLGIGAYDTLIGLSRFEGNSAVNLGAAIYLSGSVAVNDTLFCGNDVGAIFGTWTDNGGNCFATECVDSDSDGISDCVPWTDADLSVPSEYATVEQAFAAALDGATIRLSAGIFPVSSPLETFGRSLMIQGETGAAGEPLTVLDGQDATRILLCTGDTSSVVLRDVVFANGTAVAGFGGGLLSRSVSMDVANCRFDRCRAIQGGGAFLFLAPECVFDSVIFEQCAATYEGGGAFLHYSDNTVFQGSNFRGCTGSSGGGLLVGQNTEGTRITGSRFEKNASAILGGGIMVWPGGSLAVSDTLFCRNESGAIFGDWEDSGGNCFATDCVDSDGDGISDCVPWTDDDLSVPSEYATVEEAFAAALDGATIRISAGVHVVTSTLDTLGRSLTILGETDASGEPMTVLDGQDTTRILLCNGGTSPVVIRDMVFANGNAGDGYGGGLLSYSGAVDVANCRFEGCRGQRGGGACLYSSSGSVFTSTAFNECFADFLGGGAYLYIANDTIFDNLDFQDCASSYGGGVYVSAGSVGTRIDGSRLTANSASVAGGGIRLQGDTMAVVRETFFCGNTIDTIAGGTWTDEGGNCFVDDCLDVDGDGLSDCYESAGTDAFAEVPGEYPDLHAAARFVADGGVIALAPGTFVVDRPVEVIGKSVAIVGSVADGEVAAIIQGDGSSNLFSVIGNDDHAVSFSDLIMQGAGGPVGSAVRSIGLSVEIENCVIRDNSGIEGGAIRQWLGDLAIRSSILEGNTADLGGALWLDGVTATIADSSITANQAQVGGAIWGIDGSVQMMRSEVVDNIASVSGGIGAFDAFDGVFLDMSFEPNVATAFPGLSLIDSTVGFQSVLWGECCLADPDAVVDLGGNDFGWPCEDCIGDVTCDQSVGSIDLGGLLAAWGSDDPRYDLDQNGVVGGPDLGLLFTSWGECGD